MRILIASPQRSGTYLTARVVERDRKVPLSTIHIGTISDVVTYHDFKDRKIDRKTLKDAQKSLPVEQFAKILPNPGIVVTHMAPQPLLRQWFDHIIYVKREIRQALVSRFYWGMHHDIEIKPENFFEWICRFGQDIVREHMKGMCQWEKGGWAHEVVYYENLVKDPANLLLDTPTNSFGRTPKWEDIWTPRTEEVYNHFWK